MAQATNKTRKRKPSTRRSKPVPGWAWLLGGLAIGLSIAFFTSLKDRAEHTPPPLDGSQTPAAPKSGEASASMKPNDKQSKEHFDFYTILPEMEVVVPEVRNKSGQTAPIDKPGIYVLQAGSFRSFTEADHLKAQLALLGIESKIDTVTVNNTSTWHRVRVGPYQDLRELNKIRTRLLNNNISAILLKING